MKKTYNGFTNFETWLELEELMEDNPKMIKYTDIFSDHNPLENIRFGFTGRRIRLFYRAAIRAAKEGSLRMYDYIEVAGNLMLAMYEFDAIDTNTYNIRFKLFDLIHKIYDRNSYKEVF